MLNITHIVVLSGFSTDFPLESYGDTAYPVLGMEKFGFIKSLRCSYINS